MGRVPIYRFNVDVDVPPTVAAQRIRAVVQNAPTFWGSFRMAYRLSYPKGPPFIGTVQDDSFKMRSYREEKCFPLAHLCNRLFFDSLEVEFSWAMLDSR